MGQPGARKLDKIISVTPGDVHIIMVPSPGGPIPTPIPHPCNSIIKDKVAKKVKVMGQPGAVKGSISQHTPPHVPMGPGPFQKPPANKGEIITGSSNVFYEGKAAAMLGDTGKMCADPADAPVGKVIGTATTVLVGGGGAGSDAARAAAAALAMQAAAAACHDWINANMPPGAAREEAHRKVCSYTGHPIDVATGKLITGVEMITMAGCIPLRLIIDYSTARRLEESAFGFGWRHSLQHELLLHDEFVAYRDENGRFVAFPQIADDTEATNIGAALTLIRRGRQYIVRNEDGLDYTFALDGTLADAKRLPLAFIKDHFGNTVSFHYELNRLTSIIDSMGRRLTFKYRDDGRVEELLLATDQAWSVPERAAQLQYDQQGDLIAVIDALGSARGFDYDHHLLVREIDRNGFAFYFAYDNQERCVLTWGDGGVLYRSLAYDVQRGLTRVVDSRGGQTIYYWNGLGVVEQVIDPLGNAWGTVWDENYNILSQLDPNGNSWSYAYDESGNLIERIDPGGQSCEIQRDERARISKLTYSMGGGVATRYDPQTSRPAEEIIDENLVYRFSWSNRGRLQEIWRGDVCEDRLDYDEKGNAIASTTGNGSTTRCSCDHMGRLVSASDDRGRRVSLTWDSLGRLCELASPSRSTLRMIYDREGNCIEQINGAAHILARFGMGNLLLSVEGNGTRQSLRREYDTEKNVVKLTNDRGASHEFVYDLCNRLVEQRYPTGASDIYERDAGGRLIAVSNRMGRRASFDHDEYGNVVRYRAHNGTMTEWEYRYGTDLVRATNPSATLEFEFDAKGRMIGQTCTYSTGEVLHFTRDEQGYLCIDEDRRFFGQFRNASGSLTGAVCAAWSGPLRISARQQRAEASYPNGVREALIYDGHGRVQEQVLTAASGVVINRRQFEYDNNSHLVRMVDALRGTQRFSYDVTDRLIEVVWDNGIEWRESYAFDTAENMSRGGTSCEYDQANRLITRDQEHYHYDVCGNLIEKSDRDGRLTQFHYDDENQLTGAELPTGERVVFEYDALGRRIRKRTDGVETLFAWNGDRLIAEYRSDGVQRHYLYYGDTFGLLGWVDRHDEIETSYFVHGDHLGRPQEVTDETGDLVWAARYDAFGAIQEMLIEKIDFPFRSAGQYCDRETRLYYNRYRYFDPATVRYLSEDPLGLRTGLNLYAYCPNPLVEVDPLGLVGTGGNPNYDPSAAEREALRRIYGNSPGLQMLTEYQSGQEWKLELARRLLEQETGYSVEPWPREGVLQGGEVRRPSGLDRGMVDWENRRILIDPRATPAEQRQALGHEAGAVKIVEDDIAQTGVERPATWAEAKERHIAPASPASRSYFHPWRTQVLDSYVRDPEGFEREGRPTVSPTGQ